MAIALLLQGGMNMSTFGYDVLVQAHEKLLNKALAAAFYTGKLKISGTYAFVEGVPENLQGFTTVEYKVKLRNEPCLDFVGPYVSINPFVMGGVFSPLQPGLVIQPGIHPGALSGIHIQPIPINSIGEDNMIGKIGIRLSVELVLRVLTGVDLEFDVDLGATAQIGLDPVDSKLKYSLVNSSIYDLKINDKLQMHKNFLEKTNEIISIVLQHYLGTDIKEIELPIDLSKICVDLPQEEGAPKIELPVKLADVMVLNQDIIVVGVNFFTDDRGSFTGMTDLTNGVELYVGIDTDAIDKILQFWWANTQLKKFKLDGSIPVDISTNKKLAKTKDFLTRLVTLGFLEPESEVQAATVYYDAEVELKQLPEISFASGEYAEVKNLKLFLDVNGRLEVKQHRKMILDSSGFIPDTITPWIDDKLLSEKDITRDLIKHQEEMEVLVEQAKCQVVVDDDSRIAIKVTSADLELDFGDKWYENFSDKIMNGLLDILEKKVVGKIPAFIISPAILLKDVKVMGYTFAVDIKDIVLEEEYLCLRTNIKVNELSKNIVPIPLYIANTKSLKVHRFDCKVVEDIDFTHRVGYHIVYDAVNDGYKPCKGCLPGYSNLTL
jgi:hypothetical protein